MAKHLVVQLARLGDLLQCKRLVRSLAAPGDEVHLCVDASLAEAAALAYPGCVVHALAAHGGREDGLEALRANRAVFAALAEAGFDAVYILNFAGQGFALSTLFDPGIVHGYWLENGQQRKDAWADMAFRWTRARRASPLNLVDFWAHFAPDPIAPDQVNPVPAPGGGGIGVVLAGRNSRRSLPPDVLALCVQAVAERLGKQAAPQITLLGTQAERASGRELTAVLPASFSKRVTNLAGKTSLPGLFDIVGGLDLLLTPDTGVMHLAAHLGTPVEAFFLSSAWCWETGPYGQGHRVWQAVHDCAPCVENQPCACGEACLDPFRSRELLRLLTGVQGPPPSELAGLVSTLNGLGVSYDAEHGEDPAATTRSALRALVAEYLGVPTPTRDMGLTLAETLYHERDWMLASPEALKRSITG